MEPAGQRLDGHRGRHGHQHGEGEHRPAGNEVQGIEAHLLCYDEGKTAVYPTG